MDLNHRGPLGRRIYSPVQSTAMRYLQNFIQLTTHRSTIVIGTIHPIILVRTRLGKSLGILVQLATFCSDLPIGWESNPSPSTVSVLRSNLDSVTFSCWQRIIMCIRFSLPYQNTPSLLKVYQQADSRCVLIWYSVGESNPSSQVENLMS